MSQYHTYPNPIASKETKKAACTPLKSSVRNLYHIHTTCTIPFAIPKAKKKEFFAWCRIAECRVFETGDIIVHEKCLLVGEID